MKKSFLLCTLSGILFCSSSLTYALSVTTSPSIVRYLSTYSPSNSSITPSEVDGYPITTPSMTKPAVTITTTVIPNPTGTGTSRNGPAELGHSTISTYGGETTNPPTLPNTSETLTNSEPSAVSSRGRGRISPQDHKEETSPKNTETDRAPSTGPELQFARIGTESSNTESNSRENVEHYPPENPVLSGNERETAEAGPAKSRRRQGASSSSTGPVTGEKPPSPSMPPQSRPEEPVLAQPESAKPAPEKPISAQEMPKKPELEKPVQGEDKRSGIVVEDGETVTLRDVNVYDKYFAVYVTGENSVAEIRGGTVTADFVALSTTDGGTIDASNIVATAETAGLVSSDGTIKLKDSTVYVTGLYKANGIVLKDTLSYVLENQDIRNVEGKADAAPKEQNIANRIILDNTKLSVENGIGIGVYGTHINNEIDLKNSEIRADVLLKSETATSLLLTANHSLLEGRVRISEESKIVFDLTNGSKWLLKANKNAMNDDKEPADYAQFGSDRKSHSNLSTLKLTDSMVVFEKPTEGKYQTLLIGSLPQQGDEDSNAPVVYSAKGVPEIYLNSEWSNSSPIAEQKTDRVIIHGDVEGNTMVHINLLKKEKKITESSSAWGEHMVSLPLETHGVSLIQVSGKADENSFKLAGDYMTMDGLPYKYVLTAYAPGTSHENQNLLGKNDRNFWDFRLQNAYLDKDKKVRALLPQVANYLVMPNALFSAGFADVNNQNVLLDNMRTAVFEEEKNKKNGIFLSSYGEKVTLSSNRDPLHYGYGADVNYTGLQLGVVLATLEGEDISTHFGLLGTYGKLAFTPKDMEDSEKTTLDKWSLTAYSGIQHSNGLYVNALLSYGTLKGNITTALVGNAAKLDGTETLNISATVGQKITTGTKGLMFEPQAQFIYQNLIFDVLSDANGLKVDMGNPRQWLLRMGGRLTQTLTSEEEANAFSVYGKLNILKAFADAETIKIADTFYLDPTGSAIEGGIGVNATLSQNIALHGDISYRHKLQKAGVSGTNFSGGISYRF
ncbi:outer membrane autotransporter barrel domain-containing protein [Bartonella vinsonii subsp. arupensis OK-94-513]|uniref:Outer membrane autotransporter barrel domain-containing protein n=1 Tax=Bartonella vinsonii subsp. arupensis OK-94-513 TaxID=1094562 RepID=J0QS11_BARVI|nr:autotransporter outer membrane beta-barrel domain-containing protein [Bartonella vinsonii]EJF85854.1 outer membrane autotransporter barrel domain-containing protein [Bartonella vinsonii subsp. arupensis OK-94-513]